MHLIFAPISKKSTSLSKKRQQTNEKLHYTFVLYSNDESVSFSPFLFLLSLSSAFEFRHFFYTPSITGNYPITILPLEPRLINCRPRFPPIPVDRKESFDNFAGDLNEIRTVKRPGLDINWSWKYNSKAYRKKEQIRRREMIWKK